MKKIIDLTGPVKDVHGKPVPDAPTLGVLLSNAIMASNPKGFPPVKMYSLGVMFGTAQKAVLDPSDTDTVTKFVTEEAPLSVLVKGQILLAIQDAKAES